LDPENPVTQVESEVVPTVLGDRLQHVYPKLDRLQGNRRLGDVAFVVCCEHPAILAPIG
jgi:hypothetical protein